MRERNNLRMLVAAGSLVVASGGLFLGGLSCVSSPGSPSPDVGSLSCPSRSQPPCPLLGCWTSERDADECAGRNEYEFRSDGVVYVYEYQTKDAVQFATNGPCGLFAPIKESVEICWNTAFGLKLVVYRMIVEKDAIVLTNVENGRAERFVRSRGPLDKGKVDAGAAKTK